jgi:hypothetical protein
LIPDSLQVPFKNLVQALTRKQGAVPVYIAWYRSYNTYDYVLKQLPLDKVPRETLVNEVGFDLTDLSSSDVRNMVFSFKSSLSGNTRTLKALTGTKESDDVLHDTDIYRIFNYFKMDVPMYENRPVSTVEALKLLQPPPAIPEDRAFPYVFHTGEEYDPLDAIEPGGTKTKFRGIIDTINRAITGKQIELMESITRYVTKLCLQQYRMRHSIHSPLFVPCVHYITTLWPISTQNKWGRP